MSLGKEEVARSEVRRVQALTGERSLTLVLPKILAIEMEIGKGDLLKVHREDNRLIVEKAEI
jgi:Antidote-toxin recognition MazE, bacterial antitoxin